MTKYLSTQFESVGLNYEGNMRHMFTTKIQLSCICLFPGNGRYHNRPQP